MLEGDNREPGGREGCVCIDAVGGGQGAQAGGCIYKNNRVAEAELVRAGKAGWLAYVQCETCREARAYWKNRVPADRCGARFFIKFCVLFSVVILIM